MFFHQTHKIESRIMSFKQVIGDTGTAGGVGGGGFIYYLDAHSAGLAALAAIVSAIIGGVFYWLRHREQIRHNLASEEIKKGKKDESV